MSSKRTVGELKEFLKKIPDDLFLVQTGYDHSYNYSGLPRLGHAQIDSDGHMSEYYGPEYLDDPENVVKVVLVMG